MVEKELRYFIHAFTNLNTGGGRLKDPAPHKPLILLSVIQGYESGLLTDNTISITPELTSIFKTNWSRLVSTNHTLSFAMPFFRLKNEYGDWWQLIANPGCERWVQTGDLSNFSSLSNAVTYAEIDLKLADLLLDRVSRNVLYQTLLDRYFPGQAGYTELPGNPALDELRREMLDELPDAYGKKVKGLKKRLNAETYEIELYAREALFRREVVRLYDDRCCISGIRVSAPYSFTMVDACHIVPFAETFNNHPTNGIALCPNLHRAFDKGAISIDDDYQVLISGTFVEDKTSIYSLSTLSGKHLKLPQNKLYLPSLEALDWHRKYVYKG
ncbi:HNH endonuclease [uncultured Fibrella sp.]|uniref:HNH endonuclease n=1 Tax=uncultured Fibrella sp. TaxID=1284596 RepID=UPI0035CB22EA